MPKLQRSCDRTLLLFSGGDFICFSYPTNRKHDDIIQLTQRFSSNKKSSSLLKTVPVIKSQTNCTSKLKLH